MTQKNIFIYILIAFVAFVFLQSLPFKFTGDEETAIIFNTIAAWMSDVGLGFIAPIFASLGGYIVGSVELLASILLFIPATRRLGAWVGLCIISGAIFFHLATPLGVKRVINTETLETDGGVLFYLACGVWISCILILWLTRQGKGNSDK